MKDAYLLDEDVLLKGHLKKRFFSCWFYPINKKCGFDRQKIWKKDIGTILFFSVDDSLSYRFNIID